VYPVALLRQGKMILAFSAKTKGVLTKSARARVETFALQPNQKGFL
jgi:hypothetical protein